MIYGKLKYISYVYLFKAALADTSLVENKYINK